MVQCMNRPLFVLLAVFGLSASSYASSEGAGELESSELVYAYQEDKIYTLEPGQAVDSYNPLLHMAKTIAKRADVPFRVERTPVTRMFRNLEVGKANFSILVKTPKTEACCLTSEMPVHSIDVGIFRQADAAPIKSIEELLGKKIIVLHGYSYGRLASFLKKNDSKIETVVASSHRSAFSLLAAGRADYILDYDQPAVRRASESFSLSADFDRLSSLDLHLVLNRNYPDAENTIKRFENLAQDIRLESAAKTRSKVGDLADEEAFR